MGAFCIKNIKKDIFQNLWDKQSHWKRATLKKNCSFLNRVDPFKINPLKVADLNEKETKEQNFSKLKPENNANILSERLLHCPQRKKKKIRKLNKMQKTK